ncbi:hypothetical protein PSI22_19810 [Xenorhabdus sp. XENO-7]|uniref:Uncharacterized protein n=1 Tax=Xenorhabdus aichiensis TaxID=3025874 RepID=A0ABT5MC56_9GAMM|nr:hypothetical protein [Xenorhabdus aichiensis]MDC9623817.1 hypothetical protein [Xenorhabdus aichiensis]
MKIVPIITLVGFMYVMPSFADDCIGYGSYQTCTKSGKNAQGDDVIESYDSEGNSYSITSGSRDYGDGSSEVFSVDSEGNEFLIKSWCDDSGCHSRDGEGNTCTVTISGEMIGC